MSKIAIVYWSGTGNTEEMAKLIAAGAAGAEVSSYTADKFSGDMVDGFDCLAFGCPSMGVENLEESEFQPMWDEVLSKLKGKKVALFGSYGWGDGEWMRSWEETCTDNGVELACESVICNEEPDDNAKEACKALGRALV